jgi:parallel beta-helix repeat protein
MAGRRLFRVIGLANESVYDNISDAISSAERTARRKSLTFNAIVIVITFIAIAGEVGVAAAYLNGLDNTPTIMNTTVGSMGNITGPQQYYLTIILDGNEVVNQTSAWFADGTAVGLLATPNQGYSFTSFTVGGNLVSSNPTTVQMTSNHTVYVYSSSQQYYLWIEGDGYGHTWGTNVSSGWYPEGTTLTILHVPEFDYYYADYILDGVRGSGNPVSIAMTSNHTLRSNVYPVPYNTSYTIYTDGAGNYFARNDTTGQIDYSGINATTIFNDAIGSTREGGSIFVESGTYDITGTINLWKNNMALRGAGESTILNMPFDAFGILISPQNANLLSNVTIEKLKFVGPGVLQGWASCLVMVAWTEHVTIQDCYLTGAGFHAIFVVESDYALVTRNMVDHSALDAIALAQGADYCVVSDNIVSYTGDMADMNGIDINGGVKPSTNNTVINNTISWSHGGICFDQANYNTAQGNTISHVVLGIDLSGAGGTRPTTDNQIIGNTISYGEGPGGKGLGIQVPNWADRNTITGNTISYFAFDGECIIVGGRYNVMSNNSFLNSYFGVDIWNGDNTVTNNLFQGLTVGIVQHGVLTNTMSGNTFMNVTTPTA